MPFCPKCGSQVADGAKFCASCGAPIDSAQSVAGSASPPPAAQGQSPPAIQSGMGPNVAALLVYIPLCLIGLICAVLFGFILEPYKRDRFVRFHAWQSLAIHGALIVFWIAWFLISTVLTAIARVFALITVPVSALVGIGALVLMVFLMIKAYNMELYKLPIIGDWAQKQANT